MNEAGLMCEQRKSVIWNEWKKGSPMAHIAQRIEKPPATVFSYLQYHGGIRPYVRARSPRALTHEDREEISRGIAAGKSIRTLAACLGRSPSTISREINKNGGIDEYRATDADKAAFKRGKRPKALKLAVNAKLKDLVVAKLEQDWSPEQISGWLSIEFPDDECLQVSHETIYKSLYIQTRGLLRKELRNHLRTKRKFRHAKTHRSATRGQIVGGISISERPPSVEDRAIPGHWEGDLIQGAGNSYIATVVERQSRFVVLVKVPGKDTASVVTALSAEMARLPELLRKSLTWDRGTELANHAAFSIATNMDVYFCHPCSPWQRGTNENTNGLLRQYFPKGMSLSGLSQQDLNEVAGKLNSRPRKTLGFQTPACILNSLLL